MAIDPSKTPEVRQAEALERIAATLAELLRQVDAIRTAVQQRR